MKKTLLFVAGVAIAAPSIAAADNGSPYIVVRGGITNTDIDSYLPSVQGISHKKRDKAFSVLGGGLYRMNDGFSVGFEAGYGYLGEYTSKGYGQKITYTGSSAEFALMGVAHANDSLAFFLRGGFTMWNGKIKTKGNILGSSSESDNGTSGLYGGGALIGSGPTKFRVGVDVQKVDEVEVGTYTVGVQHSF